MPHTTPTLADPSDYFRSAAGSRGAALAPSADTCVKWSVISVIGLVDFVWMRVAGYQFGAGYWRHLAVIAVLGAIGLTCRQTGRHQRIGEFAHFGAQFIALCSLLIPLGYLAVSTTLPLVDARLDAIDKWLGMDWLSYARWVSSHPVAGLFLAHVYASAPIQVLFVLIYNAYTGFSRGNAQLWWITLFAALPTVVLGALLPAVSTWVYYGILAMHDLPHMQHFAAMRDGTMHVIGLAGSQGMVQLPSFHTVIAIAIVYNFRVDRWLFPAALLLNVMVIASCPISGGHYFIDILAGAAVAVLAIWAARATQRRLDPAARPAVAPLTPRSVAAQ